MTATSEIEITVGDVNDIEARVYARLKSSHDHGPDDGGGMVLISGTMTGPFCDKARTLPAEVRFRPITGSSPSVAEAIIPDPCMWSPELPHVYHADLEAWREGKLVAEYHGPIGFRKSKLVFTPT